jgi:hypothetical protein
VTIAQGLSSCRCPDRRRHQGAHAKLDRHPTVGFQQLVEMMLEADLANEKQNPGPAEG